MVKQQSENEELNLDLIPNVTTFKALNKKAERNKFARTDQDDTIDSQDTTLDYELNISFEN